MTSPAGASEPSREAIAIANCALLKCGMYAKDGGGWSYDCTGILKELALSITRAVEAAKEQGRVDGVHQCLAIVEGKMGYIQTGRRLRKLIGEKFDEEGAALEAAS